MNKAHLVNTVAQKAEITKAAATRAVNAIFDSTNGAITEILDGAGNLSLPGFGRFRTRKRAARTTRNPRTGAAVSVPERTTVAFSPSRGLKDRMHDPEGARTRAADRASKRTAAAGGEGKTRAAGSKRASGTGDTAGSKRRTGTAASSGKSGGKGTSKTKSAKSGKS